MAEFQSIPSGPKFIDLSGRKVNRLTILGYVGKVNGACSWLCRCDCGKELVVAGKSMTRKKSQQSCGCAAVKPSIDRVGQKFGMLTVIAFSERVKRTSGFGYLWRCQCDCGRETVVDINNLTTGNTKSCGCIVKDFGWKKMPEYQVWGGMLTRCYNTNAINYADYGGRGITVCDRWRESFGNFLADMGRRPSKGHSLDRLNNDGNYGPSNCRWATREEQQRNKRDNRLLEIDGTTRTFAEWCEIYGTSFHLARQRIEAGWEPKLAFTTPPDKRYSSKREDCLIECDGERLTMSEWAAKLGVHRNTIYFRMKRGRDIYGRKIIQ